MLDVLSCARELSGQAPAGPSAAVATIVATRGSVPRPVGTSMVVGADGAIRGSLSGGCVEGAVLEACQQVLATGEPALHEFGVDEDDAFAVGLMCGGSLEVLVQPFLSGPAGLQAPPAGLQGPPAGVEAPPAGVEGPPAEVSDPPADVEDPEAVVLRLPSRRPAAEGGGGDSGIDEALVGAPSAGIALLAEAGAAASALRPLVPHEVLGAAISQTTSMITAGQTGIIRLAPPEGGAEPIELFVETRARPGHLVVCGANAFGQALVAAARPLGLRITLCDQRPAFTDPAAFPGAQVVRRWPHRFLEEAAERGDLDEGSMICVLTHDPKVDVPALSRALELDVAYVGAMGSRRSDRERRAALREAGVGEAALARLHSPIGLDLGAVTPAEIAVSILAEILAVRTRRPAVTSLRDGEGPLHPPPAPGREDAAARPGSAVGRSLT